MRWLLRAVLLGALVGSAVAQPVDLPASTASLSAQALFERHAAPMLWIDPDSGHILDANAAAARFYGWSVPLLRQMRIQDINVLDVERVQAERQRAALEERAFFIFPHRLADGSVHLVAVHSTPYTVDGLTRQLSIIQDLSGPSTTAHETWRAHENMAQALAVQRAQLEATHRRRLLLGGALLTLTAITAALLGALLWRQRRLTHAAEQAEAAERAQHAALQQAHHQLQRLSTLAMALRGGATGTWEWDLRRDELQLNAAALQSLGHNAATLPRLDTPAWLALLHPQDRTRFEHAWAAHLAGNAELLSCEVRLRHRDGHWVWVLLRGQISERDAAGHAARLVGVWLDVSQQRHEQETQALAEQVFRHTQDAIVVTDPEGRIVRVNEAFCRLTGYATDEVLGRTPALLASGRHDRAFFAAMWHSLRNDGFWSGDVWNRRRDGSLMANWMSISALRSADGALLGYVGIFHDVTARRLGEEHLQRAALYDPLTGLGNRVLLIDRLQQAIAQAQRHGHVLAVVMLDLDGFKAVNDTYGHAAGDRLLVTLAQRFRALIREGDTAARLGGDEFVFLLPDLIRPADALPTVQRLLQAASTPVEDAAGALRVSASIGIAYFPQDGAPGPDALLQRADEAMYAAKHGGRNRYAEWPPDEATRSNTSLAGSAGANSQP
ncbi:diguanylate cyclase [Tepidimonas taiwanensis]|uniref:Putative diguanylate cyclase YegE n=1 Tax=Tepidimonas taiwanensis TaxID=307486 RepID=A0A554WZ82_9BURK|nr:diguanylate cyclase [Tepidimonas taiwanensis]MCX7693960.1 diguanylate cyclase [Tepidimonas taiwanensis]MDM7463740.1 diguanylate cyclase [Tepidimonas taiwanensis]TSE28882.1 putative diguanylate cyclase YegE [Tepidimonas taiwanensis]UBQ05290.1 diguanylate cyclase [Tepidimonas taiwanensis]